MAIGSAPEIGTKFAGIEGWLEGKAHAWRLEVGGDLLGGYARLAYIPEHRRSALNEQWEDEQ